MNEKTSSEIKGIRNKPVYFRDYPVPIGHVTDSYWGSWPQSLKWEHFVEIDCGVVVVIRENGGYWVDFDAKESI